MGSGGCPSRVSAPAPGGGWRASVSHACRCIIPVSARSSQGLSLCVLCPDFPLIRTPVIGFRALPNPAGPHPHLITSAKTFFLNRVTSPGYVSLWRSQANPPRSCSLGSIWPVPEPSSNPTLVFAQFRCLGCQTLACGVCVGPMMPSGSPGRGPLHSGSLGLPSQAPFSCPAVPCWRRATSLRNASLCPRICHQHARSFIRRVRIPQGLFLG